ncbi:fatty acid synthase-like [Sitophilus oryzae]|uniref:Fatty acid synthase n=1 Tax=Sitophilus oryzae TaxID=7048 RepID=A0A6J2X3S1_SITOR|nr:fatty acid synthase-like [Sitophilus oryzae]
MDEIAITGISGRIAKSKNLEEFKNALLGGVDLVTHGHGRWNCEFLNTPKSIGVMCNLDKFDAGFFGVNPKQADCLDPRTRHLIELSFECVLDAGISPQELRGSNTGVYLAIAENVNKGYMDRSLAVMANSISFYLDLKGPSIALDAGCSASAYALCHAFEAMMCGSCDRALVCAAQCHLQPQDSAEFNKLGVLSKVGKCRTFDDDRDGYVKSEGIICILIERVEDAKRIYATISGIGSNIDGYKSEGIFNPSSEGQLSLLKKVYDKFKINPDDVEYVEAHGTGTLVGDIKECTTLASFFATKTRKTPLKVGSAKTNVGHCENAAAFVSLMKLLVTIQTGTIPAHIHYQTPALDIVPLEEGLIEVCSEQIPYNGGLLALSSFGLGGTNGHVVIRPYLRNVPSITPIQPPKKRLVLISSRTEEGVQKIFDKIEENRNNLPFLTILDNIAASLPIEHYRYRGYKVLNTDTTGISKCNNTRPVWFSYSGMGSQWPKMGMDLMHINVFRKSIEKCANVLKPFGFNLIDVITNPNEHYDDPEKCFPAIISVSVALTDILNAVGIKPDGIIGHSLGEIGCAYGDGLLTLEEAVLVAHARGLSTKKAKLIPGLMAAVGLSLEQIEKILPKDIYVACHNSSNNVTISGPKESVENFVNSLTKEGYFAKIVNTLGVAFHSNYIENAAVYFIDMLRKIIPISKERSKKWLPSAISENEYDSYLGKFNSAEYQHHNFLNRVRFQQVLAKVPENAVLIEIAPRGLFQSILARSLPKTVTNVSLSSKDAEDNCEFLLSSIGKVYSSTNIPINLTAINDEAPLPLDARTPFISPLVQWDHASNWAYDTFVPERTEGKMFSLNLRSNEHKHMWGHVVDGTPVFPSGGILFLVWSTYACNNELKLEQCPVIFEFVQFLRLVNLTDTLEFYVNIFTSGHFEVLHNHELIAKGKISTLQSSEKTSEQDLGKTLIGSKDIYSEFHLRGLDYSGLFQKIENLDISGLTGTIVWSQNWATCIESIIQCIIFTEHNDTVKPSSIIEVKIDPLQHKNAISKKRFLKYSYNKFNKTAICGGVRIKNMTCSRVQRKENLNIPYLHYFDYVPYAIKYQRQLSNQLEFSLCITLQIVHENRTATLTQVSELSCSENNLNNQIYHLIHRKYFRVFKYSLVKDISELKTNPDLLILPVCQAIPINGALNMLGQATFIFCKVESKDLNKLSDDVIFECSEGEFSFVLLKKAVEISEKFTVIEADNGDFKWIEKVKESLSKIDHTTYLISKSLNTGLIGFYNCLKEEQQSTNLRIFIIDNSVDFYPTSDFYSAQVKKNLGINIYTKGQWSSFRMIPLNELTFFKNPVDVAMDIFDNKIEWTEFNTLQNKFVIVKYATLSNCDTKMYKSDYINASYGFGMEFSGKTKSGKSIMGISTRGCLKTTVEPEIFWILPDSLNISLEAASTIPLDYTLVYYGVCYLGKLKPNDTILISGTDNSSLAAVYLAVEKGCKVIIDISTSQELSRLQDFLDDYNKVNTVCSENDTFLEEVLNLTSGSGVSLLFTSDERNINKAYVDVLANNCKLITLYYNRSEIDSDILNAFSLKRCQIYRISLKMLLEHEDETALSLIKSAIQLYLNKNALKPFHYTSVNSMESADVMKYLDSDPEKKLVVNMVNDTFTNVKRRIIFDSVKSYIIVGGLGGIGMELAKWLIRHGAKKIILNSRSTALSSYKQYLIENWKVQGVTVIVNSFPAQTIEGATKLLKSSSDLAPVGGIFNLAMHLINKTFINLSPDDFLQVVSPKLHITLNMSNLSEKMCPKLEHFVVFSAMAVLGTQAVSNFSFGNSAIELVCKERQSKGLPALAVQWGMIGDVGFTTRANLKKSQIDNLHSISSCLETLEQLMLQEQPVVSSSVYLSSNDSDDSDEQNSGVLGHIASILGAKSTKELDMNIPLSNLGIDSISSLEIKNFLIEFLGIEIVVSEIRKLTLENIKNLQIQNS